MKIKFKSQSYQTAAVEAVVDCFKGQPKTNPLNYRLDKGVISYAKNGSQQGNQQENLAIDSDEGFRNADIKLDKADLLRNIQQIQSRQNLPVSQSLTQFTVKNDKKKTIDPAKAAYVKQAGAIAPVHLDVEMETGTGKTYCYIKTMFEMNQRYGWSKFIIVVPSIAIREGVTKSLKITADHFTDSYGKKVRFFTYNSKQLHELESFSSDSGINVMVINIQAFNATGKDNRRIYEELDDFQSRRPIDVISKNRPILFLDEPQKMEGDKTLESLAKFKPLMVIRYSATHKTNHLKIHRLDALDAYNQKLVKKIAVRGISVKGQGGTASYLYLENIEISKQAPKAWIEMEMKQASGKVVKKRKKIGKGDNLYDQSNKLDEYKGYVVADINANADTVEFTNGIILTAGDAHGDVDENVRRRIQIRETIKAHLEKEDQLFKQGIKVLSLFFIDEVAKYRDYDAADNNGQYAAIFEEEYTEQVAYKLDQLALNPEYHAYLKSIQVEATHEGYFSIDKKGKMVDSLKAAKSEKAESTDVNAYDLILKDKEALLSLPKPTDGEEALAKKNLRFIFSHSALREGWDNPNVFTICMLKNSDNSISRRQEVGRGLRISVNQNGERQDKPSTVHDINVLTVVASESYQDFVTNLQTEIADSLAARPRKADKEYFTDKILKTDVGEIMVTELMANQIYRYLMKNEFTNDTDEITPEYHVAKAEDKLPELPVELKPYSEAIFNLVDGVFDVNQMPDYGDGRKPKTNPLNANFNKKEFKELWNRINKKVVYKVDFDSKELIANAIAAINKELTVTELTYRVETGELKSGLTDGALRDGKGFAISESYDDKTSGSVHSRVEYDLLGKIGEAAVLTRKTVAAILTGIEGYKFGLFKKNPEQFIAEVSRLIKEQKASIIINKLSYDETDQTFDSDIFTASQSKQDFSKATEPLKRHIYDYVVTDSKVEKAFAEKLDVSAEVVVYAKLPGGFFIPTPVGDYNPDWAISFKEGTVKHVYFIAETKGSMSSLDLRGIEGRKIECARKFFEKLENVNTEEKVKYDVVTNYDELMSVVS
ncbi:MAG: DEAD/DEAH box helicase family protein [Cycloclasticus sp.]